jgi:hypothetical protein
VKYVRDTFSSLRSLGDSYQFVKRQRSSQKNRLEVHVKAFQKLVSILWGVGQSGMDTKELEGLVQSVDQAAQRQREDLGTNQKEIQDEVAACVEGVHVLMVQGVARWTNQQCVSWLLVSSHVIKTRNHRSQVQTNSVSKRIHTC